ncbi:conserved exported hypothetical protein [uncultured Desulfovibrio sp.]|uniref:Lipoprotein n=1 Tax=uncultured Desulfovibrio sp. TaxID=167968 RepID=A0A212KKG7_9BACT|nr:conserved exported hypothetical protein [uncultured Desulfovibrio sp.]
MRENTVLKSYVRYFFLLAFAASLVTGCSSYQPTKNVWKSTKSLWNTYVSPPATVDFEEKGNLSPQALSLTHSMMGIDVELTRLERTMLNADKPPTREWLSSFLTSFPWVSGFAGVKYDGTILGQEPANPMKPLDFIPLLYEDKKQSTRALRADVQNSSFGPEVLLASPLYDGTEFLGVVVANFDMRSLMQYSQTPQDVVILSPQALLWPGKYDFASTPLAGVNWDEVTAKSTSGTCTNVNGTFYYNVRFLGNVPLIFAVAESGNFPQGNGSVEQGLAFFPKDRPKLTPPPHEVRKNKNRFEEGLNVDVTPEQATATADQPSAKPAGGADIQPGSKDSMLLKRKNAERRKVQERQLAGENASVDRAPRASAPKSKEKPPVGLGIAPDEDAATLPGGRPSPFGPKDGDDAAKPADTGSVGSGKTDAPAAAPAAAPATAKPDSAAPAGEEPAALPGGRPSPFGPRN